MSTIRAASCLLTLVLLHSRVQAQEFEPLSELAPARVSDPLPGALVPATAPLTVRWHCDSANFVSHVAIFRRDSGVDGPRVLFEVGLTSSSAVVPIGTLEHDAEYALYVTTENVLGFEFAGPHLFHTAIPCAAEFNSITGVDTQDLFGFLAAWSARNPSADFDDNGSVTISDLFTYLTAWLTGC